jgi:hypothetical protein
MRRVDSDIESRSPDGSVSMTVLLDLLNQPHGAETAPDVLLTGIVGRRPEPKKAIAGKRGYSVRCTVMTKIEQASWLPAYPFPVLTSAASEPVGVEMVIREHGMVNNHSGAR